MLEKQLLTNGRNTKLRSAQALSNQSTVVRKLIYPIKGIDYCAKGILRAKWHQETKRTKEKVYS